jgi:hypothetical protein
MRSHEPSLPAREANILSRSARLTGAEAQQTRAPAERAEAQLWGILRACDYDGLSAAFDLDALG